VHIVLSRRARMDGPKDKERWSRTNPAE
jgi:hypothetical protein